jgi:class III lanthionine synthetase
MIATYGYVLADDDFYLPLSDVAEVGREFAPTKTPTGWTATDHGMWRNWRAHDAAIPEEGWKVHISSQLGEAQNVLDAVAETCFSEGVSFKHIRGRLFFLAVHHKHGPRQQAGKFCVAYPRDEETARRLMDRLAARLRDAEGPYILTDRRYRESRVVHYRWGSFMLRGRRRPDGRQDWLVRDGFGNDVLDERGPAFSLPDGITDPFAESADESHDGSIVLGGSYRIDRLLQHSNAGGSYQARDLRFGRRVFIKEARAHNGLGWDGSTAKERLRREREVLMRLHAASPGVCPEPLDYFREWEHEFLVTEFVAGVGLNRWAATRSPIIQARPARRDFDAYYAECERILGCLDRTLTRIHDSGYRFGDLSPTNIMVDAAGAVRLVDFEAASPLDVPAIRMGTDGFTPPPELIDATPAAQDDYGASAVALMLLFPFHGVLQRRPGNLMLLRRDLEEHAPVAPTVWHRAERYCQMEQGHREQPLPSPRDLDAKPRESLEWLAGELRRDLLGRAEATDGSPTFPTVPQGFETNTTCIAYGTAGVVHALRRTGAELPPDLIEHFRTEALRDGGDLAPGLHVGAAGVAWVLADLNLLEEAAAVLDDAREHPLARRSVTLGEGLAGIGLAHLALHRHTGDARLLDRAATAGDAILLDPELTARLGPNGAIGLLHGRAGVALFLYFLAQETGDERYLAAGAALLHEELDLAVVLRDGALSFPDDATAARAMPYLYAGSAGVAFVLTRYAASAPDERFAARLPLILDDVRKRCTTQAGLYCGLAGLAFVLSEHADWTGDVGEAAAAVSLATGLMKHAIPHMDGIRFLGDGLMRYSAELWSGSAGVLLALDRVLHGGRDHFFTIDAPLVRTASAPAPAGASTACNSTGRKEVNP